VYESFTYLYASSNMWDISSTDETSKLVKSPSNDHALKNIQLISLAADVDHFVRSPLKLLPCPVKQKRELGNQFSFKGGPTSCQSYISYLYAPANMVEKFSTFLVSNDETSPVKLLQSSNIPSMVVTDVVFQVDTTPLNAYACLNTVRISLTLLVCQAAKS
jgi:hypothetical protein